MKTIPRISNAPLPLTADAYLKKYAPELSARAERAQSLEKRLTGGRMSLADFACAHEFFGLHPAKDGNRVFREYAPNAEAVFLTGDFCRWQDLPEYALHRLENGAWEVAVPRGVLQDGMFYAMDVTFERNGVLCTERRVPAYARFVLQDETTKLFCACVHDVKPYVFRYPSPPPPENGLFIYEAHTGMAQEEAKVGSFDEFRKNVLPRIAKAKYNTLQLMAVMGHPYYGSFGYHVGNFFAVASRFGTPEEFKKLVDEAHKLRLRVIIDLVHSHAVKNEADGLGSIDGSRTTYFHAGARGEHTAWDSLCFDYGKIEVLHFLLSNCRYYLDEFHVDGFRFDGVTSMMYYHHGLGYTFTSYEDYFNGQTDEDAIAYLTLANKMIHSLRPDALTVAEDVSGMPGLASKDYAHGGIGFDCRLSMGVTDMWFKLFDVADENWDMFYLWHELSNGRRDERSVSYVECHDQAIVGGKTAIFTLADAAMYDAMDRHSQNPVIDRAIALHKVTRLLTSSTASDGYLNFMGNEFGHPEWIDFPREGNNWSMHHARRQWSLADDPDLRFSYLASFDRAMLELEEKTPGFFSCRPQIIRIDNEKKVLIYERANLYFCVNLNPVQSFDSCEFPVLPGEFHEVLDSDWHEFGGFELRDRNAVHFSLSGHRGDTLKVYLPSRTALVLERGTSKK